MLPDLITGGQRPFHNYSSQGKSGQHSINGYIFVVYIDIDKVHPYLPNNVKIPTKSHSHPMKLVQESIRIVIKIDIILSHLSHFLDCQKTISNFPVIYQKGI